MFLCKLKIRGFWSLHLHKVKHIYPSEQTDVALLDSPSFVLWPTQGGNKQEITS